MDVFLLLMVGALSGYLLALFFSWFALVWWGPVLAVGSAAICTNMALTGRRELPSLLAVSA
jgi:hypothetical protein